jgi:hypothetical protein
LNDPAKRLHVVGRGVGCLEHIGCRTDLLGMDAAMATAMSLQGLAVLWNDHRNQMRASSAVEKLDHMVQRVLSRRNDYRQVVTSEENSRRSSMIFTASCMALSCVCGDQ